MSSLSFADLAARLGRPDSVITDLNGYEEYCRDATEETGHPLALVLAESEEDVVATVTFAAAHGLAIVPRGAGTGLSGGAVPSEGSLVLSVERMTEMHIDPVRHSARCGPGVITANLMKAAEEHGLTYPPDPASFEECSLGGNVAENAGGLRCRRYGVTRDYVIGLRGVTADGGVLTTGVYNDHEAFDLSNVIIGSEGTLAIVTEIAVRLIPTPKRGTTILVAFDTPEDAARTVAEITASGIVPTVMEYLDGDAAACSNQYERRDGLDSVAAILLLETSAERDSRQTEQITSICRANHSSYLRHAAEHSDADELWRIRRNLSKAIREAARFRYNEDIAVPISSFAAMIAFVAELNRSGPLRINAFGHAGDGNLHVSFLSITGDAAERRLIAEGVERLYRKAIALGGTLTGEHGIGLHKGRYLPLEFDAATLGTMRAFKDVFDPEGLLNPGKIFVK